MIWCWGLPALILYYVVLYWNQPAVYSSVGADYLSFGYAFWIIHYVHLPYTQFLHLQPPTGISGIERVAIKLNKRRRLMELLAYTSWVSLRSVHSCNYIILPTYYGRPLSVAWAKSMLYFANVFFLNLFLWPPYAPAQVNGGSRKFYTYWTLSVGFFLVLLKLQGGPKSDEMWHIFRPRPQTFCSHARTRQNIVILKIIC